MLLPLLILGIDDQEPGPAEPLPVSRFGADVVVVCGSGGEAAAYLPRAGSYRVIIEEGGRIRLSHTLKGLPEDVFAATSGLYRIRVTRLPGRRPSLSLRSQ